MAPWKAFVSDIAMFVLKRDVKLELTNLGKPVYDFLFAIIEPFSLALATRQNMSRLAAIRRGRSVQAKISGGRGRPPAYILIPLERQLIALQLCRCFYVMKLCSRLVVLYCQNLYERRQI